MKLLFQAALVAISGVAFALLANQLSPRGLNLSRNYFPNAPVATNAVSLVASNSLAETNTLEARLQAKGLKVIGREQLKQWVDDPRFAQELIICIDARDDDHYTRGHIPGAFQFDHYYPQNYLATVLPACQTAEQIVVYCNGGNCEDSEFTALSLKDAAVPIERIHIFPGGFTEWATNGLPVEVGPRKSGNLQTLKP